MALVYLLILHMYLGGPTFESRVGLFSGEGSLKRRPSPSLSSQLSSSPMVSRGYGNSLTKQYLRRSGIQSQICLMITGVSMVKVPLFFI